MEQENKDLLKYAEQRMKDAARYGEDMKTSRDVCIADAMSLIRKYLINESKVSHE